MFCVSLSILAQDKYIVSQFGTNLSNWASGQNPFLAFEKIESLCSSNKPTFCIADTLIKTLAQKNGMSTSKHYPLNMFLTWMQTEIDNGVSIKLSNINTVSHSEINNPIDGYGYVSCNISISGSMNLDETALFILTNNKIASIQNYVRIVDKKNGKHKIEIDWSDFDIELDEDTEGWGLSYNYSKAFPVGASVAYTKWKFMIGLDFGINTDKKLYTTQKVDFINIVDYKITRGEYDLKYYITATPSFYLKYFSIGWGVGYAYFKGTKYTKDNGITINPDGTAVQIGSSNSIDDFKYKVMMRPTVKGYIPCSENFFISLSVNYDWILGCKEKSSISFGAGIHLIID